MLHAVLAAYILCFAGGVTLVVVASFASRRFSLVSFRDFAFLFVAATLLMLVDALKTYERVVGADFGPGLHVTAIVLSIPGNAGLCWYLVAVALQVVRIKPAPARFALHAVLAAGLGLLGGLKEAEVFLWLQGGPAGALWTANHLALLGVNTYAAVILILGFARIESLWLRSLIRSLLLFFAFFVLLAASQVVLKNLPAAPAFLRENPIEEMLYFLGFVVIAMLYISRFFSERGSERGQGAELALPEEFVRRFGISHRERDIIEMMAKGFSNNAIAEKLYISTLTVKNHVYHIYQKTGARNKIQLLNIINSSK